MISQIVFAAGCFWGVEKHFESLNGVLEAHSGYVGGNYPNPTYEKVLNFRNLDANNAKNIINYTEGVLVKFDTEKLPTKTLIQSFWQIHDPTQLNRQGNDIGGKIVTQIKALDKFYKAEEYHQNYLSKNPDGYCPNHSTGVEFKEADLITPMKGKEIIIIENENFCPYCEKLKKDLISNYKGSIRLRTSYAKNLKDFKITSKLDASPTILFIENGKEVFSHIGYIDEKAFYKLLGEFRLGKTSEAYKVAFSKDTDARFCKQYDIFKNTPDGVFIDKLSGDILFDTRDRFDSGSGWLSFYKAAKNATIEKNDFSYGMHRIEVLAKKSGIHLGHVFDEKGHRRFCINASVLEFVKREDLKK
ncbi:MAG: peptide methionine sulfoxide reductase [Proteobacteria bacterium]|nr:MAG: peptide methionine sulfoxide reductase [Pseudomonadota bacterium]